MLKDNLIFGAIVGLLANAVKLTVNFTAFLLGFTPVVFWQLVATRFLQAKDLFNPLAYIIGGAADLITAAVLGVIFVYFIYLFGKQYLWLKGLGFGLVVWVGLLGTLLGETIERKLPQEPAGIMVTLVAHSIFGLALAFFAWWLQRRRENPSWRSIPKTYKSRSGNLRGSLVEPGRGTLSVFPRALFTFLEACGIKKRDQQKNNR